MKVIFIYIYILDLVNKGIIKNKNLHTEEKLKTEYKISEYKYKDELYEELFELLKI